MAAVIPSGTPRGKKTSGWGVPGKGPPGGWATNPGRKGPPSGLLRSNLTQKSGGPNVPPPRPIRDKPSGMSGNLLSGRPGPGGINPKLSGPGNLLPGRPGKEDFLKSLAKRRISRSR